MKRHQQTSESKMKKMKRSKFETINEEAREFDKKKEQR